MGASASNATVYTSFMKQSLHRWIGWTGTIIALVDYGLFSAGFIPEVWFFAAGAVASVLLTWALVKDHVGYGATLQAIFIIFNLIGMTRLLFF